MSKIAIIGAGTWGIALAQVLYKNGHNVTVGSVVEKEIDELQATYIHPNLHDVHIDSGISFTKNLEELCNKKDIIIFAVASIYVRSTVEAVRKFIPDGQIIVDVAKGIEEDTLYTMTQVIQNELEKDKEHKCVRLVALSGPTHAEEVIKDVPTAVVCASEDLDAAQKVQDIFTGTCIRVYTNTDILGVELCGAMKNIIALATGVASGLGYGDNTKAALITRGMAEITRLGLKMGCMEQTFTGLAGVGDLIVTATSEHSRNNKAGQLIGKGYTVDESIKEVGMVVEGLNALPAALRLIEQYGVEMPIVESVSSIVYDKVSPQEIVETLMQRETKLEIG